MPNFLEPSRWRIEIRLIECLRIKKIDKEIKHDTLGDPLLDFPIEIMRQEGGGQMPAEMQSVPVDPFSVRFTST
ncbi:MAG: hypothetical protein D3910_01620 [Candidatus Electrothrix sp. ATG2]|nr:hypothetical protein [Candidatus Electrothrix sp. ATG2]